MTQHIKTHFKERGINSLAANGFNAFASVSENGSNKEDGFPERNGDDGEMSDGGGANGGEDEDGYEDEEDEIEPC
jgi:hypothetical protein